jgi:hypothetical protein
MAAFYRRFPLSGKKQFSPSPITETPLLNYNPIPVKNGIIFAGAYYE